MSLSHRDAIRQLNQIPVHIRTQDFTADILWWGMYEDEWWRNYLHVHSFYEICYAFDGTGTFLINNHLYDIQAGDLFIARPGDYHEIISSEQHPLGIYFWSYTLSVQSIDTDTTQLLNAYIHCGENISRNIGTIPQVFTLLTDEVIRREAGYIHSITSLTTKLLLETARSVTNIPVSSDTSTDIQSTVVRKIVQYLKDNYHQPILIRDIAAQVHMSERHVSRLFLQSTGKTIKTYLTDLRLDKACNLLLQSSDPIAEVAQQIGYPDARYFSTLFRKQYGRTPTVFREQNGTQFVK